MKKIVFAIAAVVLFAAGCTHDVPEVVSLIPYQDNLDRPFTVLSESDIDAENVSWNTYDFEDDGTKATYTNAVNFATGLLSTCVSRYVHQVVGKYVSRDLDGNPVEVSGKIFYPKSGNIRNVIIASHYTIGSNAECPSESYSFEGIYAAFGYAVIVADYLGFGITSDMIHPYLQANTTAGNVLDMALAAVPFLKDRGLKIEDDEVILLGYSQGGATTLHVQRLLETDTDYKDKFKIKKTYCGAGPYDIGMTYDYCIKKDVTGIHCAVPMIIQGMSIGMTKPLDMDYFFQEPLRSNYKDWLNSKKYTVAQMSALIGSNRLSEILTENGRDKSRTETARFYLELKANSIPSDYFPKAPLFMFHSEDDSTVPFVNSQIIQRQIRTRIAQSPEFMEEYSPDVEYDFGHYGNHQAGATKFFSKVLSMLK